MKKLLATSLGLASLFMVAAPPAAADCKSDLLALKARLAREREPTVLRATERHVKRAEIEIRGSESECRNAVTRGWRALAEAQQALALEAKAAAARRAR
jgi:hypothetical protein